MPEPNLDQARRDDLDVDRHRRAAQLESERELDAVEAHEPREHRRGNEAVGAVAAGVRHGEDVERDRERPRRRSAGSP